LSSLLSRTLARGHLDEVTLGLHSKGTLPADYDYDYDSEFDWQTGSLDSTTINAWAGYVGRWEGVSRWDREATSVDRR
jgi:hypothetical protein